MKLYLVSNWNGFTGAYVGTKAEAKTKRKQYMKTGNETGLFSANMIERNCTVKLVDVPTDKVGLLAYLNKLI